MSTLARQPCPRADVEFDVHTWSSTCERETPRAHVDMVDVRTWSSTCDVKLHVPTCSFTCEHGSLTFTRGVLRENVKLYVGT